MINFKFQFPDKEVSCLVPETWEEMTVKQAMALNLKTWSGDALEGIARLAGVGRADFNLIKLKSRDWDKLQKAILFLAQPPPALLEAKHKSNITIKGKDIDIPEDLNGISFGQAAMFPLLAEHERALSLIIALYLQPIFDGKLGEYEEIETFSKEFEDMLFIEVFPIVNFFFPIWREYKLTGIIK